uniref:Uncharacterized protein n=1 Tax=Bradyrhizobium ottawaense TaxID=931866 RepID=A0A2U8PAY5_9BRAD|nr:hypothetical protein CIT37_24365 [Bradyrhizobium ottawaense]
MQGFQGWQDRGDLYRKRSVILSGCHALSAATRPQRLADLERDDGARVVSLEPLDATPFPVDSPVGSA